MTKPRPKRRITRRTALKALGASAVGIAVAYPFLSPLVPILPSLSTPDMNDGTAWISVGSDGEISMFCPIHEMGQGSSLGVAQIAAEELNVDAGTIKVILPSTKDVPTIRFTTGSLGIAEHARPVAEAAARLREELRRRAAVIAGLELQNLADTDGGFLTPGGEVIDYKIIAKDTDVTLPADKLPAPHLYTFDPSRTHRQVGKPGLAKQSEEIVAGSTVFAGDIRRPGMVYGRTFQAPGPNAQVTEVDFGEAESMQGVLAVVDDRDRNLVGVVADTPSRLEAAMSAVSVTWDRPNKFTATDVADLVDIDYGLEANDLEHVLTDDSLEPGQSWEFNMRFDQPPLHHAAQELRCAVAEFSMVDGQEVLDVWTGSQDTFVNQKKAAAELGWSRDRITIHSLRVGGGFGGRVLYDVVREAVILAKAVGRPVKVEWSRRDEFLADRMRPPSSHRIMANLNDEGLIADWRHACRSGYVLLTEMVAPEPTLSVARYFLYDRGSARGLEPPYTAMRKRIELGEVALPFHVGEWRSLGAAPNIFVIESAIDEIARVAGFDPVAFRLANLSADKGRLKHCLRRVEKLAQLIDLPVETGAGRGFACGIYDQNTYVAASFDIRVDLSNQAIVVDRCCCVLDAGLAISPDQIRAQIEGCAMMAIGQLLSEEAPISEGGLSASSFTDYPTPTINNVPDFEIEVITQRDIPPAGVGQAPIVALVPAIANAFRDATGSRLYKLPVDFNLVS